MVCFRVLANKQTNCSCGNALEHIQNMLERIVTIIQDEDQRRKEVGEGDKKIKLKKSRKVKKKEKKRKKHPVGFLPRVIAVIGEGTAAPRFIFF